MGSLVMHRTLLIGGAGYIGTHLAPLLLAEGRNVTVLGRSSVPKFPLPSAASYVKGDFSRPELICALLAKHDEVVHLAYASVPNTSYSDPLGDLLENLPPAMLLFSEMAQTGGRLVLISSGGTVYGEARSVPITEQHPTYPISPYGVTKLTLEKYAQLYASTRGLDVVCIRPANAYGAGQVPFTGQGFIATAMALALRGEPIRIFGERGTERDYLHVKDLASGITHALKRGASGEIYNLGSGIGRSNMDVIEAMRPLLSQVGSVAHIVYEPERPFDVKTNVLDASRLRDHTGWQPQVNFTVGLREVRDWLRSRYA